MFNVHGSSVEHAADLADMREQSEEACWSWKVQREQECSSVAFFFRLVRFFDTFLS